MPRITRVLGNSLPRGGSALLVAIIEGAGYGEHQPAGPTPRALNYLEAKQALDGQRGEEGREDKIGVSPFAPWYAGPAIFRNWLDAVAPSRFIFGHLPYSRALDPLLGELGFRHLVILRDPAEILTSLVFDGEIMPRFLTPDLEPLSLDERLGFMIDGGHAREANATLAPFAEIYRSMLAWRDDAHCLAVRFETLVGDQGEAAQRRELAAIANQLGLESLTHLLAPLNDPAAPWSAQARAAQRAHWQATTSQAQRERIRIACQAIREEAGYSVTTVTTDHPSTGSP